MQGGHATDILGIDVNTWVGKQSYDHFLILIHNRIVQGSHATYILGIDVNAWIVFEQLQHIYGIAVLNLKNQCMFRTTAARLFWLFDKNIVSKKTVIGGKTFVKVLVKPDDAALVIFADIVHRLLSIMVVARHR